MNILPHLPPEVKDGQLVSLDFETFDQEKKKLHRPTGTFAMISIAIEGDPNVYQLYDHNDLRKLVPVINRGVWIFHNATYDLTQFRRFAEIKPRYIHDTMLVDQSMNGGYYKTFSLADLVRRWLGIKMEKEVRDQFNTKREITPEMKTYGAIDAVRALEIAILQRNTYEDDPAFKAYLHADEPMIFPMLDLQGFRVDAENWETMVKEFERRGKEIEDEIDVNVWAHAKVKEKLKKDHRINVPNTENKTLIGYLDNPFVRAVIEARMYRKAASTYGMKWLEENVESDGKVYASYHISGSDENGVSTGRMSCTNPNMQNIPQRKLPQYRERFLASDGNILEIWDVAQQEPCITAYHSHDVRLLEAIRNKEDLHLAVARDIYENPTLTKENDQERGHGKAINLGLTYGLTAYGLASRTNQTVDWAEAVIKKYFQKYSGVHNYINTQRLSGFEKGYVTTALGRRSYLNIYDRKWENNAINAPIQGGAADFQKIWARKTWEKIRAAGFPQTTNGYIHDETTRDTPKEIIRETSPLVQAAFEETAEFLYKNIPFRVEVEFGRSWAAKKIKAELVTLDEMEEE